MPLMPKRVKYRKVQRGSNAGLATTNNKLDFGDFALQALTRGYVTNNQIEAARVAINRHLKRRGKVWIRLFPFRSFTFLFYAWLQFSCAVCTYWDLLHFKPK